jgi:hypothetical protein
MDGWMDGLYDLLTIAYDERRKRRVNYLPWLALLMNRSCGGALAALEYCDAILVS